MGSKTKVKMKLSCRIETELQMWRANLWLPGDKGRERDWKIDICTSPYTGQMTNRKVLNSAGNFT